MKQATLDKRRASIAEHRSGEKTVIIPFAVNEMIPTKDCPICRKPSPMTDACRFVCRACRFLFS